MKDFEELEEAIVLVEVTLLELFVCLGWVVAGSLGVRILVTRQEVHTLLN